MKDIFYIIIPSLVSGCIMPVVAISQQTAMFEHPVYFEDGLGNRDTLIIGGDTSAIQGLNPQFGEIPVTMPFDSVFEARAMDLDELWNPTPVLQKKIIGWSEKVFNFPESCEIIESLLFVIHIKHFPLKIFWDSKIYADSLCILGSYVSAGAYGFTIGPWTLSLNPEDENLAYCVAQHDSVILDIGQGLYPDNLYYDFLYPVEGGTIDTMLVLMWGFDHAGSSLVCGHIVSTDDPAGSAGTDDLFRAYPNPVPDLLTLQWEPPSGAPAYIMVLDVHGKPVYFARPGETGYAGNTYVIETSALPTGMYFVRAAFQNGTTVKRFVKI